MSRSPASPFPAPVPSAAPEGRLSPRFVLPVLLVYYAMNYMDRSILAVAGEAMRLDLGLSDAQMGVCHSLVLASLIFLILPCSALSDLFGRRRMIALSAALWGGAMLLTGTAASFRQLAAARFAAGVNDAFAGPGGSSWLARLYPPEGRGRALGLFYMSSPLGMALGTLLGGAVLALGFGWRAGFLILAPLALTVAFLVPRLPDNQPRPQAGYAAGLKTLLRTRTLVFTGCAVGFFSITQFAGQAWLPALFQRSYHLSGGAAGVMVACMLLAGALGSRLGGGLADRWQTRSPYGRPLAAALCLALMTAYKLAFYQCVGRAELPTIFVAGLVDGVLSVAPLPIFSVMVQDVAHSRHRNLAMGVMGALSFLAGGAWGPLLGGLLSQAFGSGGAGLRAALSALLIFGAGSCLIMLAGARTYSREKNAAGQTE